MASTTIYKRLIRQLTATAAFGLLTATSQAGLFCDWNCGHKRPYCTPACHPTWGYHETCWRQFPPTKPCTDWGAHCSACATGDTYNYGNTANPGINANMPHSSVPMVPAMQQPQVGGMMQQPLMIQQPGQNPQMFGGPMNNAVPQGNWNAYNANPAPVPPVGNQAISPLPPQPNGPRTFGPAAPNGQLPNGQPGGNQPSGNQPANGQQGNSQPQNGEQLQLPGLNGGGNGVGGGDFELPPIPDLSQSPQYYNPGFTAQGYGNQYQPVSQANTSSGYGQPLLYPNGNAMANPGSGMGNQQQYGQAQYGQAQQVQPQQNYAQPMMMPGYSQSGNQLQAPQPVRYTPQPTSIQVVPGRQPSVLGVSMSRSIRPAVNNMNVQQSMPAPKRSFLSKINPFSK